jgi:hypothetical protein
MHRIDPFGAQAVRRRAGGRPSRLALAVLAGIGLTLLAPWPEARAQKGFEAPPPAPAAAPRPAPRPATPAQPAAPAVPAPAPALGASAPTPGGTREAPQAAALGNRIAPPAVRDLRDTVPPDPLGVARRAGLRPRTSRPTDLRTRNTPPSAQEFGDALAPPSR